MPNALESQRALRRGLFTALITAAGLPLLGWSLGARGWEALGIATGTVAIFGGAAFIPWARYRREIGRPLGIDRFISHLD